MTGETQLRARRTRIKILKAIADRNGTAGFSDIKISTGLSTGSIYYHLERMGSYVTKDSKHYVITEEGIQLLREVDPKYSAIAPPKKVEEGRQEQPMPEDSSGAEETVRQARQWRTRRYASVGAIASIIIIFSVAGVATNWQAMQYVGMNAGVIAGVAVAAAVSVSLLALNGRRSYPLVGYRGMMFSVGGFAALLVAVLAFSDPQLIGAAPSPTYDNSMDALLSSYSMHWQVR